jgi:hypothetical protein
MGQSALNHLDTDCGREPGLRQLALPHRVVMRLLLGAGCLASLAMAMRWGRTTGYLSADPALVHLLRGMAVIKATAVLGALAGVYWRLGWRVAPGIAAAYLGTTWTLAGSTMLIWQLAFIPAAAVLFHAALVGLLWASWRDDRAPFAALRFAFSRPATGRPAERSD